jgi:plasmid stability protein
MGDELTLAGVPSGVLSVLKARAKAQGRSVEEEAKAILEKAICDGALPPVRLMAAATPVPIARKDDNDDE